MTKIKAAGVTDDQAIQAAKTLKSYCKMQACGQCVLGSKDLCGMQTGICPAFWVLGKAVR